MSKIIEQFEKISGLTYNFRDSAVKKVEYYSRLSKWLESELENQTEKMNQVIRHVDATLVAVNNNVGCEVGDEKIYIPHVKQVVDSIQKNINEINK